MDESQIDIAIQQANSQYSAETLPHAKIGTLKAWLKMALNGDEDDRQWVKNRIESLNTKIH